MGVHVCVWLGRGIWKPNGPLESVRGNRDRRDHFMVLEGARDRVIP